MPRSSDYAIIGKNGEELVASWLQEYGYQICSRNYRCRSGEIDLIVQKKEIIAFVEVKRRLHRCFHLSEVITKSKQRKIASAAQIYMTKRGITSFAYRFDVALVEGIGDNCTIVYIEHAFTNENFIW